jgi:aminopeptidase P-like protein
MLGPFWPNNTLVRIEMSIHIFLSITAEADRITGSAKSRRTAEMKKRRTTVRFEPSKLAYADGTKQLRDFTKRRFRVAKAIDLRDEIVLVGAGEPVPLPEGSDQMYPFRAHSEYYYLTGIDSPGGVLAFDPRQRSATAWVSFVPEVTEAEKTWEGRADALGTPLARLEAWLGSRRGRPIINLGAKLRGVRSDEGDIELRLGLRLAFRPCEHRFGPVSLNGDQTR